MALSSPAGLFHLCHCAKQGPPWIPQRVDGPLFPHFTVENSRPSSLSNPDSPVGFLPSHDDPWVVFLASLEASQGRDHNQFPVGHPGI